MPAVKTSTPPGSPAPIGPYSHIAQVGSSITIGGVAGVSPVTGALAGEGVEAQTRQILANFAQLLESVGSDLSFRLTMNLTAVTREVQG